MDYLKDILEHIAAWINIAGVSILLYGFVKFFVKFLGIEFVKYRLKSPIWVLQSLRCEMGVYILLTLDFLIASDIILSIVVLSQEQLIQLGVLILIRITIGYFLSKEIEAIKHDKSD